MKIIILNDMTTEEAETYALLVNECYKIEEAGIWKNNPLRTNTSEILTMVQKKEIVVIKDGSKFVGGIRVKIINEKTATWRMLWIDKNYRGKKLTSKLFKFIENDLRERKIEKIIFEVLRTVKWPHPKKDQLIAWYRRIGYKKTSTANFLDYYPENKDFLATDVEFYLMEKDLTILEPVDDQRVIVTGHLNSYILKKIFSGETSKIIIKNFTEKKVCDEIVQSILSLNPDEQKMFTEESYSKKLDTNADSPEYEQYKSMVQPLLARIRSFSNLSLAPMDKLRLIFDEIWPEGANLGISHGFKMYAGKIRLRNSNELQNTELSEQKIFDQQFVAKVYLETSPESKAEKGDLYLTSVEESSLIETSHTGRTISIETYFAKNKDNRIQLWS